jgi:RsmE family RNA methyltransferase
LAFLDDLNPEDFLWAQNIVFDTDYEKSSALKDLKLDFSNDINIFVWPEWGFDEEEKSIFEQNNFSKVYLGNRILRTETVWFTSAFYIIQNNL